MHPTGSAHRKPHPQQHNRAGSELREQMLVELAKSDTTDLAATCHAVSEAAAVLVGVARASVWRLEDDKLVCDDLFLRDDVRHTSGQAILRSSCPTYFETIAQSMVVRAHDAHTDARTRELDASYLGPLGIGAMLDTPIWQGGALRGVLCCEHVGGARHWTEREVRDAARMADLVGRSIEASTRRTAEERWRFVAEALPQFVIVVDEQGKVIEASAMAKRAMEEQGGSTLTARFEDLELHNLAGALLLPADWPAERARRGETVRGEVIEATSRVTGQTRWLRATCAPVRIGESVHGAVAIYEDVGEEIRIERVKREVLSGLAHELRTPTTIVKGYAQRLMKAPGCGQDERRALEAMARASTRIERLAEDLVALSAITLGRIVLSPEHLDLTDLALRAVEGAPASRTHLLRFVPSSTPARVFADPLRMRRVIGELIENASRYSNAGSEIDVEVRVEGDWVNVLVRDRGAGVPEEARDRLFEPLFRASAGTPSDVGGLGIGLFLVREIVTRHGGRISFESKQGAGTTFVVGLPLDEESG